MQLMQMRAVAHFGRKKIGVLQIPGENELQKVLKVGRGLARGAGQQQRSGMALTSPSPVTGRGNS